MCLPESINGITVQRIAAVLGNLLGLSFGLMFGITPAHGILYSSPSESPFRLPVDEKATIWIVALLIASAAVGAFLLGQLSHKIGPKSVLQVCGIFQVFGWFCVHFGTQITHIYASRVFVGFGGGGALAVLPIFLAEIAEDANFAAALTATVEFWRSMGVLLGFALGIYVLYDLIAIVGLFMTLFFTLWFPFVRETPFYFMNKGNADGMEKSLRWYRGIRTIEDREKSEFLREVKEYKRKLEDLQPIVESSIPCSFIFKLGFFCFVLLGGSHLAGVYVVLNFSMKLFSDPNVGILFAGVQFVGSIVAYWMSRIVNRKITLTLTGLISGFTLVALACAEKWTTAAPDTAETITIGLLCLHIFSASIGLQSMAIIVTNELLPPKLRTNFLSTICSLAWLLLFAVIMSYHYFIKIVDLSTFFGVFAGACFAIVFLAIFALPDTKNKTADEIQFDLGFVINENVARITTVSNGHIHESTYM